MSQRIKAIGNDNRLKPSGVTHGTGRPISSARAQGGQGSTTERIPFEVWGVSDVLPTLAKAARTEIIAGKSAAHRTAEYHPVKLPYGMRRNRAICPDCYAENGPGKYDPATGRCKEGC